MYKIRFAQLEDLPALVALDESSNPYPWGNSLILDSLNSRYVLAVEREGEPGIRGWLCASYLFEQSELELIAVAQNSRRQGLAKALMRHWINDMVNRQVCEFLLEVRESNKGAIALYSQLGFEVVGIRKHYYQTLTGREHACLMSMKQEGGHKHD